ncbi:hypothetical protein KC992_04755, partial [Candidatus Saccharibacteria bacterium]|nr:hypothetical protein [Candidatus Saccharibacteria bacterium]
MGEKKKIEIAGAPDDENIDLKADVSEETQDVWAEKLDEVESETEENVDPESEEVEQDSASDTEAANEDVPEETGEETSQDEETQPESDPEDDGTSSDDDNAEENVDESEHESKVSSDDVESEGSDNPEPEQQDEKPETADDAVDEIVREESNAVLKAEDEARQRFNAPAEKKSLKDNLRHFFAVWWKIKRYRYGTLVGLFVALLVAVFVPYTRYGMLNLAGVRVSSSMVVVDSVTGIPLKNIPVQLQGKEARSDDDGKVSFTDLRLGRTQLKVDKRGYAQFEKYITLGWGSNPIGEQGITATGAQFKFVLTDWLTGKPVTDAEATSGEDVGQSDDEGRITLTVGEDGEDAEVVLSAKDYREERLKLSDINQEETA